MEISGRNHFVPKFLLDHFACSSPVKRPRSKKKVRYFVYQFAKAANSVLVGTRDAAVGNFFYGEPENGVEHRLSKIEAIQVEALRRIDSEDEPERHIPVLSQLIWMLSIRTQALRRQFASAGTRMLEHMERSVEDDEVQQAINSQAKLEFERQFPQLLKALPRPYQERAFELLADPLRREAFIQFILNHVSYAEFQAVFRWLKLGAGGRLDLLQSAANGQIRGLSGLLDRNNAPIGFAPQYWKVINRMAGTFVLGDNCAFATDDQERVGTLLSLGDKWKNVYLPISSRNVLVASMQPIDSVMCDEAINMASAELSESVFFSSCDTLRETGYVCRIGTGDPVISGNDLATITKNSWINLGSENSK